MIKHIVMFKLKSENKSEVANSAKIELESLVGKIDGLLSMEVGINFLENPDADIVLTATYPDKQALKFYASHPLHQQFLKWFVPTFEKRFAVDYQV